MPWVYGKKYKKRINDKNDYMKNNNRYFLHIISQIKITKAGFPFQFTNQSIMEGNISKYLLYNTFSIKQKLPVPT